MQCALIQPVLRIRFILLKISMICQIFATRIRIRMAEMKRIQTDPDPQYWIKLSICFLYFPAKTAPTVDINHSGLLLPKTEYYLKILTEIRNRTNK